MGQQRAASAGTAAAPAASSKWCMQMLYWLMYSSASAWLCETAWSTSAGMRLAKRSASRASAHCRRDHFSPSRQPLVERASSGKFNSTTNASLLAKKSSSTWAAGS